MTADGAVAASVAAGELQVVVMGVSAAGKSTVARAMAERVVAAFVDADDLHPAENVARMASGLPLRDEDRWPWLERVGEALHADARVVVACSALRRVYREQILARAPGAAFIHLSGSRQLLERRASQREHHFMPASLLASQLETLEPLDPAEPGVTIDIGVPVGRIVDSALDWLTSRRSAGIVER